MKKLILVLCLICSLNIVYSQKIFENKQYEFAIQEPKNWIEASNKELLKNFEKFKVDDEKLTKLITVNKGSLLLVLIRLFHLQKEWAMPLFQLRKVLK